MLLVIKMSEFESVPRDGVLRFSNGQVLNMTTGIVGDLIETLGEMVGGQVHEMVSEKGVSAEVLSPGDGWRKGRVRFSIEFVEE